MSSSIYDACVTRIRSGIRVRGSDSTGYIPAQRDERFRSPSFRARTRNLTYTHRAIIVFTVHLRDASASVRPCLSKKKRGVVSCHSRDIAHPPVTWTCVGLHISEAGSVTHARYPFLGTHSIGICVALCRCCRLCPCVAQYTQRQMIGTRDASPTNVHASHEPETHASSTSSLARGHPTPRSKPKITSPSARCARACATNMAQCRLRIERCAKIKRRKKKYFGSLILSLGEERGL